MKHWVKFIALFSLTSAIATSAGSASALNSEEADANNTEPAPAPAVEEYNYPGADQIFAERGIRLIKGDGHIVLADCKSSDPMIKVESVTLPTSCFRVIGAQGWLTVEIPRVYLIRGGEHNVSARITVNGKTEAVDIPPGGHKPVGEGSAPPGDSPATLVELQAS
ncbi:hypothetical protein SAMN05421805_1334 [Saccharopolyspora antimicrobica]|uniref:Secreted protein n=1 Tax=Saccharopolyspora antimicrobica TaxID=455193 RepID=A0A1I5LSE0_9PSEU|nr:hypothetical protein [Saccharopolyspora antimicrobica]RKT87326.1 hypothetical protein ATL45_5734 [Saccharopolyspora antimicrobica]SFP00165.1 hypothetical protein SAMN05421805_1334 [Saccharopolyspora antimicrobica]